MNNQKKTQTLFWIRKTSADRRKRKEKGRDFWCLLVFVGHFISFKASGWLWYVELISTYQLWGMFKSTKWLRIDLDINGISVLVRLLDVYSIVINILFKGKGWKKNKKKPWVFIFDSDFTSCLKDTRVCNKIVFIWIVTYVYIPHNERRCSDMWEIYIFNVVLLQNIELVLYSKPVVWEA